jgi:hypothetical protein
MIGCDDFDRPAGGLAAVVLGSHFGGDHRADALIAGEHAGLIVQYADLDGFLSCRRSRGRRESQHANA